STLIVHGDKDKVVPVRHAITLRQLGCERKLPIEVKIYEGVDHMFQIGTRKFDWLKMNEAEQLTMKFLQKPMKAEVTNPKSR
ncbi:MAG TPA: dienelactone hydrolase family protein, partial [Gemmataceae bacterium]|nr:dienelactone hydrolase family protein [Gemmataceae bacterium]